MRFITPAMRVSISLVFLTISIILTADLLGILPDTKNVELDSRKKIIELLALQISYSAENGNIDAIEEFLVPIQERYSDIYSAGLRNNNDKLLAQVGNHQKYWDLPAGDQSTPTHVRVPIFNGKEHWGTVEVTFSPLASNNRFGFNIHPVYEMILFVGLIGFIVYLLFMKKTLKHLDPSAVIPDRVKATLDTLSEGVVLMDTEENIVLTNIAFAEKAGYTRDELLGKNISKFDWILSRRDDQKSDLPWKITLREGQVVTGKSLRFKSKKETRSFSINSTPILDSNGKLRGALTTFDDITILEQKNLKLKRAMGSLKKSQSEIKEKNKKLEFLATTDPMTNCLNRRAFFELFSEKFQYAAKTGEELCCFMADIDHFKSVNDTFGHGAGDIVIQKMAQALKATVRKEDIVCRYGGEEFCILMPGLSLADATATANRAREAITPIIYNEVSEVLGKNITASFGVSSTYLGADDEQSLVEQADMALYASKEGGRNRVTRYDQMEVMEVEPNPIPA